MGPEKLREQLKDAYRRLFNPLIRILIRNGVTATEATDLVKRVYVDACASEEFQVSGQRISDTRIAILTGLSRKEVHKLRNEPDDNDSGTNLSRISRLIAAWNQDPDFTGPYGLPLAIPFDAKPAGDAPSFTELVRRHGDDITPRAMLDELLRTELASIDDDGLIRNSGRTYIPSKLDPASVERLGRIVGRLADTLDFNNQVEDSHLGRYEREVTTDIGLTEEQYRQFNYYLRAKCQQLLETIDNWLATQEGRLHARDKPKLPPNTRRVMTGIGVFHFLDQDFDEILKRQADAPFEDEDEEQNYSPD
jgi:hypothetical protein